MRKIIVLICMTLISLQIYAQDLPQNLENPVKFRSLSYRVCNWNFKSRSWDVPVQDSQGETLFFVDLSRKLITTYSTTVLNYDIIDAQMTKELDKSVISLTLLSQDSQQVRMDITKFLAPDVYVIFMWTTRGSQAMAYTINEVKY